MNTEQPLSGAIEILKWAFLIGFNIIGAIGFLLIVYGFFHQADPQRYSLGIIDETATPVSQGLTLVGVLVAVYSIYFPVHTRRAHPGSRWVTVPFIVTPLLLFAFFVLFSSGRVPDLAINGFAIMGLTGAVFRLLPYTFRAHAGALD